MRGPRRLLWNCAMNGHRPIEDSGDNQIFRFGGQPHVGRVCAACKCAFFLQVRPEEELIIKV
jgi:hypothetical protein